MADYRGGDNAGFSPHAAEAIKNINSGNTPGIRNRELVRRAAIAASQAFLMGAAGTTSGLHAKHEDNLRKQDALNDAKLRASRMPNEADTYKGVPRAASEPMGMRRIDDRGTGSDQAYPMSQVPEFSADDIKEIGKRGLATDEANKAAAGAPVTWGGQQHFTPSGLSDMTQNSAIQGQDINTAQDIMSQFGEHPGTLSRRGMQ